MKAQENRGRNYKIKIVKILFAFSVASTVLFVMSGYGYQWGIWDLGAAFSLLTNSAYAAIGLIFLNMGGLYLVYRSGYKRGYIMIVAGLLLTIAVFGTGKYWQGQAEMYPPIHDITTDLENPPEFDALVEVRADSPNPPEYAGEETAEMQREVYSHIEPVFISTPYEEVFDKAVSLVESYGWELVNADRATGVIEATDKLAWFGFKDDVVLRLTTVAGETRIDMRSKSRIGRGDLGVNAHRIEMFLSDLEQNSSN